MKKYHKDSKPLKKFSIFTIEDMKPVWAAYFNMARMNMYATLCHISTLAGIKDGTKEDSICSMSVLVKEKLNNEEKGILFKELPLCFPFLNCFDFNLEQMRDALKLFSQSLSYYRNQYSHCNPFKDENTSDEKVGTFLLKISIASQRIIKERFGLEAGSMDFITAGRSGKKGYNTHHFLYPKNGGSLLSDVGKLQLLSLFLDKKDINELLVQSKFLNSFDGSGLMSQRHILLEVFSSCRFNPPRLKMNIERDEVQVALDILNEIQKCPDCLYDLLGDADKSVFNIVSETGDSMLLRRSSDRFVQLVLSYFDSTNSLKCLRFQVNAGKFRFLFDENKTFCDGSVGIRVIEKDLNAFVRLQEFERLRMVKKQSEAGCELWNGYSIKGYDDTPRNDESCLPYITDKQTAYLLEGDNIGLSIGTLKPWRNEPSKCYMSEMGDFVPEIRWNQETAKYEVNCKKPDCIISRFELPGMLFYHLLSREKDDSVEQVIADTVWNYRRFFINVKDGILVTGCCSEEQIRKDYGIALADIPEKLRQYLFPRPENESASTESDAFSAFSKYKNRRIEELKAETDILLERHVRNLERIKSADNKVGKRSYVRIQSGKLADWLAKDIVYFQNEPPGQVMDGRVKITGANYSLLQKIIATLYNPSGSTDNELNTVFRNLCLVRKNGEGGSHPFLNKIHMDVKGTSDFYQRYLVARKEYLEGFIEDNAYFLHANRRKWQERDGNYYKELAEEYLDKPVMLPRGLFEDRIIKILEKRKEDSFLASSENQRHNTSFLIDRYFCSECKQPSQFFYGCERPGHQLFELFAKYKEYANTYLDETTSAVGSHKVKIEILRKAMAFAEKCPYDRGVEQEDEERLKVRFDKAYRDFTLSEKAVRRYAVQDKLLFRAAANILEKHGVSFDNVFLQDVRPDREWLLNQKLPIDTKVQFKDADGKLFAVTLHQDKVKILNYGKIKRILHDSRVPTLLSHFKDRTVNVSDLELELSGYDRKRIDMFRVFLDYEKKMLDGDCPERKQFSSAIIKDNKSSEEDKEFLRQVRNAFCHNAYPSVVLLGGSSVPMPGLANLFAERVVDIAKNAGVKV